MKMRRLFALLLALLILAGCAPETTPPPRIRPRP